jgi:hypothetical protein
VWGDRLFVLETQKSKDREKILKSKLRIINVDIAYMNVIVCSKTAGLMNVV